MKNKKFSLKGILKPTLYILIFL